MQITDSSASMATANKRKDVLFISYVQREVQNCILNILHLLVDMGDA